MLGRVCFVPFFFDTSIRIASVAFAWRTRENEPSERAVAEAVASVVSLKALTRHPAQTAPAAPRMVTTGSPGVPEGGVIVTSQGLVSGGVRSSVV